MTVLYDSSLAHSLKTQCPLDAENLPCCQKWMYVACVVQMGSVPREEWIQAGSASNVLVGWVGQMSVDS